MSASSGSSPRARGTLHRAPGRQFAARFIPASAGNTARICIRRLPPRVHPRERGEHASSMRSYSSTTGSSPRARGTPRPRRDPAGAGRFIPASAGNTGCAVSDWQPVPVHPRERGEHSTCESPIRASTGSSPRARGTLGITGGSFRLRRFIPASAGNTEWARIAEWNPSVHPRERGEHLILKSLKNIRNGSSPRARGTPSVPLPCPRPSRFIPASAGNTGVLVWRLYDDAVHPRERGEHELGGIPPKLDAGSSPRARGTPQPPTFLPGWRRFIPASAGNTPPHTRPCCAAAVHPRERGEHSLAEEGVEMGTGSSPRARGTRRHS